MNDSTAGFLNRKEIGFKTISRDEAQVMIEQAPTRKSQLIIRCLFYSGARISEIVGEKGIRPCDINKAAKELVIRRLKRRKPFEQAIPLDFDLMMALLDYVKNEKISAKRPIFPGSRVSAWKAISDIGQKAIDRAVSPKMFRHGKCYEMIQKGIHPLVISRAMGHATMSTALHYSHPTMEDMKRAFS